MAAWGTRMNADGAIAACMALLLMFGLARLLEAAADGRALPLRRYARRAVVIIKFIAELVFVVWAMSWLLLAGVGLTWYMAATAAVSGAMLFGVPAAAGYVRHWYAVRRGR